MIQSRCRTLFLSVIAGAAGLTAPPILAQSPDPAELATTVQDGFTIATVGDLIIAYPMEHMLADPGFREVVELIQTADVATGNLETNIIDGRTFRDPVVEALVRNPNPRAHWWRWASISLPAPTITPMTLAAKV